MTTGIFVTIEGGEGAGKSTSLAYLESALTHAGCALVLTREPGGTAMGERVRDILLHSKDLHIEAETELLLMFAARMQHINEIIRPALANGKVVICDRFTDASYAYQGGGRGLDASRIAELEQWVQADLRPNLTLLFDIPVEQGLARAGARSEPDRFEREHNEFFDRVRAAYLKRAQAEPDRIAVIDASLDIEDVQQQLDPVIDRIITLSHGQ
jgi:dTMP kinase